MHKAKGEHKAHVKDVRSWKRARVKGALRSEVKQSEVKRSEGCVRSCEFGKCVLAPLDVACVSAGLGTGGGGAKRRASLKVPK